MRFGSIGNGSYIRTGLEVYGNAANISIGNNFQIWHRCFINVGSGTLTCGNDGHLGVDVYINAARANVRIGNNVAIAPKTQIYSYSDGYEASKLIGEVIRVGDVIIGNNILIGSGAIILPGVRIADGAIIGAGSVVNRDVGNYEIVAGIPARKIKVRPR